MKKTEPCNRHRRSRYVKIDYTQKLFSSQYKERRHTGGLRMDEAPSRPFLSTFLRVSIIMCLVILLTEDCRNKDKKKTVQSLEVGQEV
jgi:hypothetical protein